MEELAPLLDSSADKPRNEQAMSTKRQPSPQTGLPRKGEDIIGRESRGSLRGAFGRLLQSHGVNAQVTGRPEGTPSLRFNDDGHRLQNPVGSESTVTQIPPPSRPAPRPPSRPAPPRRGEY